MELHSFQFIQKNIRCKTNEKCHDLPMDDDDDSPGPAEALRQRRFWPQDFFAAKICFSFRRGKKKSINSLKNLAL